LEVAVLTDVLEEPTAPVIKMKVIIIRVKLWLKNKFLG
jgi:hypothetical protein